MSTDSADFSPDQKRYLEGFFAGVQARGVGFGDLAGGASPSGEEDIPLAKEERIKREKHPLDAGDELFLDARGDKDPEAENIFRYKWNGLFWLNPVKDGYMCRLRIPGGIVRADQARTVASVVDDLTSGYLQITTRANFQLRVIRPKDCPEVLRRIQACGLHSRGAGGDNIRNITSSPTAGVDPHELIDVRPLVNELAAFIINTREFYDLPRKFNIALDGGGLISCVEDTNDIGYQAVRIAENGQGIEPGVYFRVLLGGVTGHQTFARDWGVLVRPDEVLAVTAGILRVFLRDGDRSNRKKARLKYLLEKHGFDGFREDCEALLKQPFVRMAEEDPSIVASDLPEVSHAHIGFFPQKQEGLFYIGAEIPVGQITTKQLRRVAELAESYGSGELRLTVWQNLILPDIPEAYVATVCRALQKLGFATEPSALRSGFIACTGNRYCKYASSDTKGHALAAMAYLDKKLKLDRPVNVHFTGCPHSCAQHFMGDIGLLATKVKHHGESVEGYHITVGGGWGGNRKIGRQVFTGVPATAVNTTLESIFNAYLVHREDGENFQSFCNSREVRELQELFCEA